MTVLAILLAVAGAGCYAFAARLQHGAVRAAAPDRRLRLRAVPDLVRQPRWLLGLLMLGLGAGTHAVALGLAPLTVVQPVGVLAVPLTAVLHAREHGTRVREAAGWALAASTIGLAAFVVIAANNTTATFVPGTAQVRAGQVVGAGVVLLAAAGTLAAGRVRCLAFATAGGACYGLVSVLMRAVSQRVTAGDLGEVSLASVAGIVVAMLVGGWFVQLGYASGTPDVVVACLTVVDPLVAVATGVVLLGEASGASPLAVTAAVGCAALAAAGVIALARSHPRPSPNPGPPPAARPRPSSTNPRNRSTR
ncbi:MAG TPA: hypothetical protein VIL00_14050 [Pseudonocardiaceae bacterium]